MAAIDLTRAPETILTDLCAMAVQKAKAKRKE